jgi:hypothetical protein
MVLEKREKQINGDLSSFMAGVQCRISEFKQNAPAVSTTEKEF